MFELLSLVLFISLFIAAVVYVIRRIIPMATLALLGGIVLLAIPIGLLVLPNDRTVIGIANLAILYLLGNLLYFALKEKVPSRAVMIALGVLLVFSLPIVANTLVQQEERGVLNLAIPLTAESGPIVLLGRGTTLPNYRPTTQTATVAGVSPVQIIQGDRISYTAQLYRALGSQYVFIHGGERIPRFVDKVDDKDQSVDEGNDIRSLLIALGIPSDRIIVAPEGIEFKDIASGISKLFDDRSLTKQIILVASASDMALAKKSFEKEQFKVAPAPTDFHATSAPNSTRSSAAGTLDKFSQLLPSPEALSISLNVFSHALRNFSQEFRSFIPR